MKQVEIHLKKRDSDTVIRAIKAFEPVDWIQFDIEQADRKMIRVLAHDGRCQILIDAASEALQDCRDWRITIGGDGHDNATRVQETGHGLKMHRANWTEAELAAAIETLLTDRAMHARLAKAKAHMQGQRGTEKAAKVLVGLLEG